jgi:hypothetical protein
MGRIRYAILVAGCATLAGSVLAGVACGGGTAGDDKAASGDAAGDGLTVHVEGGVGDATATNRDSGCAADTQVDVHNCGICGHDCLGGACQAGVCQPVVLATVPYPGAVAAFAIDTTSVYWTNSSDGSDGGTLLANGVVSKCPLAGCTGHSTTLATGQAVPEGIWVTGPTLYWVDYNVGAIMQCSVDCNNDATVLHKFPDLGRKGFAANATEAFISYEGAIEQCPTSGCGTLTTFASGQTPTDIALGAAGVTWIDLGTLTGGKAVVYVDGGVMTCPVGGCDGGPTALATGLSYPSSLFVNGMTAYWAQGNSVVACSVTGCSGTPTTIVSLPAGNGVAGVAVDATDVYFGDMSGNGPPYSWEIRKCALTGCPDGSTLLSSTQYVSGGPVLEVAVDTTRIYFVSGDNSQILALAK